MTPMILVTGIILKQFSVSYHEKIHAHLEELIQNHRQSVDTFLKEKLRNIRFLMELSDYRELSDEILLRQKLQLLQREYGFVFVDLGVVNDKGIQVSYAGPFMLSNADYSNAKWYQEAMKTRYYISDVFTGLRGHPHFIVSVRNTLNGRDWILRATIDFGTFNFLVENISIGETGFAFILNREGEFQTRPEKGFVLQKDECDKFFNEIASSRNRIVINENISGDDGRYIYASAGLKEGSWMLVYRQDVNDAYFDLNQSKKIAVWIIIIGSVCIITMAVWLSIRIVNRIATVDSEKKIMNQQVIETGKLASIGELAAGIAHEINNPVAIMVEEAGWIQDLLEEEEFTQSKNLEEFERSLNQIRSQGKRCKQITHKLLSFARKTDSQEQNIPINSIVEEIVELSTQMAKYNNVTIQKDLQQSLPDIRVSPSEMQQVLLNLINNAIDAMAKSGGQIIVRTRMDKTDEHMLRISVEDNGPGIPSANLSSIFDPFFTTKPVGKGTGLGLSICYGIIQKIGGTIDVESTVGYGSTFTIKIPIHERIE